MTGPKLNEGALLVDGSPTTKATAKYLRGSATKAREVLDLIRGLDVRRADEVLQFTTRDVAKDIRKVLASAVANAVHNDEQDADELFVLACFADEGPTLRRFRPRARGRATRIRKRTCHITVVVARLSDERLEILQSRQQATSAAGRRRAGTSAQARRERVERSRTRAQRLRTEATEEGSTEGPPEETPAADVGAVDEAELASVVEDIETADVAEDIEVAEPAPVAEDIETAEPAETAEDIETAEPASVAEPALDIVTAEPASVAEPALDIEPAEPAQAEPAAEVVLPEGAVEAPEDGSIPAGHEIKANASSMKYHVPGGRYYDVTIAEVFFDTAEHAEAAGYEAPAVDTEESS